MNSVPALAGAVPAPVGAPRLLGLYLLLILMAAIEGFDGLSHLPILFGDMSEIPGTGFGGTILKAVTALHPVLALTALALATAGRLRHAIIVLGSLVLTSGLNDLPAIVTRGVDIDPVSLVRIAGFPLAAAGAIALAARGLRLDVATLLVCNPHPDRRRGGVRLRHRRIPARFLTSTLTSRRGPCRKSARGFQ